MFFLFNRTREIFISFAILYSLQSQSSTSDINVKDALLAESAVPLRSAVAIRIKKAAVAGSESLLKNLNFDPAKGLKKGGTIDETYASQKNHMFVPMDFALKKLDTEGVALLSDETSTAHLRGKSYLIFEQNETREDAYTSFSCVGMGDSPYVKPRTMYLFEKCDPVNPIEKLLIETVQIKVKNNFVYDTLYKRYSHLNLWEYKEENDLRENDYDTIAFWYAGNFKPDTTKSEKVNNAHFRYFSAKGTFNPGSQVQSGTIEPKLEFSVDNSADQPSPTSVAAVGLVKKAVVEESSDDSTTDEAEDQKTVGTVRDRMMRGRREPLKVLTNNFSTNVNYKSCTTNRNRANCAMGESPDDSNGSVAESAACTDFTPQSEQFDGSDVSVTFSDFNEGVENFLNPSERFEHQKESAVPESADAGQEMADLYGDFSPLAKQGEERMTDYENEQRRIAAERLSRVALSRGVGEVVTRRSKGAHDINRVARGYLGRKKASRELQELSQRQLDEYFENEAATNLQKRFRGMQGRKAAKKERREGEEADSSASKTREEEEEECVSSSELEEISSNETSEGGASSTQKAGITNANSEFTRSRPRARSLGSLFSKKVPVPRTGRTFSVPRIRRSMSLPSLTGLKEKFGSMFHRKDPETAGSWFDEEVPGESSATEETSATLD